MTDHKTELIVKEWVIKYDAAVKSENYEEMLRIVNICTSSPNKPFKSELLKQLESI